jgi:hypothetical protein
VSLLYERLEKREWFGILGKIWPVPVVLVLTVILSLFSDASASAISMKVTWVVLIRFLRLTVLLLLPVFLTPYLYSSLRRRLRRGFELVHIEPHHGHSAEILKIWFLRPFQGIGLTMLIATKLILLLEIYTGNAAASSSIFASASFNVWRFLIVTAVIVFISVLLSFLWGLDDLGIRLYKEKTGEVRMIGRYVGLFLPVIFGFYGVYNLLLHFPQVVATRFVLHIIMITYPPFLIFTAFHAFYFEKRRADFLGILGPRQGKRVYSSDES